MCRQEYAPFLKYQLAVGLAVAVAAAAIAALANTSAQVDSSFA